MKRLRIADCDEYAAHRHAVYKFASRYKKEISA